MSGIMFRKLRLRKWFSYKKRVKNERKQGDKS